MRLKERRIGQLKQIFGNARKQCFRRRETEFRRGFFFVFLRHLLSLVRFNTEKNRLFIFAKR